MYDHNKYVLFFNFSVWSAVSSFLHIMITHNIDFCKTKPPFSHLNRILLLMMKMDTKQFLFHLCKIRAEG